MLSRSRTAGGNARFSLPGACAAFILSSGRYNAGTTLVSGFYAPGWPDHMVYSRRLHVAPERAMQRLAAGAIVGTTAVSISFRDHAHQNSRQPQGRAKQWKRGTRMSNGVERMRATSVLSEEARESRPWRVAGVKRCYRDSDLKAETGGNSTVAEDLETEVSRGRPVSHPQGFRFGRVGPSTGWRQGVGMAIPPLLISAFELGAQLLMIR